MQGFERGTVKPRADATDIAPAAAFAHGKHQRAKILARASGRGESHNHYLLALARPDLQPFACASAGIVESARELRHYAFLMGALGTVEGGDALTHHISAVFKPGILWER